MLLNTSGHNQKYQRIKDVVMRYVKAAPQAMLDNLNS